MRAKTFTVVLTEKEATELLRASWRQSVLSVQNDAPKVLGRTTRQIAEDVAALERAESKLYAAGFKWQGSGQ